MPATQLTPAFKVTLLPGERADLHRLEARMRTTRQAAESFAEDLVEIRDKKLYRDMYDTFREYCEKRWLMKPGLAYKTIAHQQTVRALNPPDAPATVPMPTGERQTRPLKGLPDDVKREAWSSAVDAADGEVPSGTQVEEAVARVAPTLSVGLKRKAVRDVESAKAAGIIPANAEVIIEGGEDFEAELWAAAMDLMDGLAEDEAKPAEQPSELTDEEFLAALPLREKLAGYVRARFDADALLYRNADKHRIAFQRAIRPHTKDVDAACPGFKPPYRYKLSRALTLDDPSRWHLCGDCNGTTQTTFGKCPTCHGAGYHVS